MTLDIQALKQLSMTIRMLAVDAVERAKAGHPGMPMGMADAAAVLWSHFLRFNPRDPEWMYRDRFVLSAGHGSMLQYAALHLFGYDVPLEDIRNFRQWGSKTPGHPEFRSTAGVETTTGPLGQGFANGVGMALSAKMLGARYSRELFEHRVFGIVSDGDLMEGISSEAASLAGFLKLGNLTYLYDRNFITIGGSTELCFTEDIAARFESAGWHVQSVDGHDYAALHEALAAAVAEESRPSLIVTKTVIGFGSPHKAGTADVHGAPLGQKEVQATKEALGWPKEPEFLVPPQVTANCQERVAERVAEYEAWQERFTQWKEANAAQVKILTEQCARDIPETLREELIEALSEHETAATRVTSGVALQVMAKHLPGLVGGSADLEPSNKSLIKDSTNVGPGAYEGRNIRFGVREHAMGAIVNGLAYSQCWIPYSATFLVFSDYMRPAIRLAALARIQSLFLFSHDSLAVGEDGPTHQPVEHIAALRLIPNLYVFRPADGLETAMCYWAALQRKDGPSALLFTRQGVAPFAREDGDTAECVQRGAYIVQGADCTDTVLVATGSEVELAIRSAAALAARGKKVRVVSMPCQELFFEQPRAWRESIIPSAAKRISLECGITRGWERIVGSDGLCIGFDEYGVSAPKEVLADKFGFTPEAVADRIERWA